MQFTEPEMTTVLTAAAKATLTAQSRDLRKGRADVEDVWRDLGGYGRYQLLSALSKQVLPVLDALPDVPRVHGERPSFSAAQVRAAVEAHVEPGLGRVRRAATVLARAGVVQAGLAALPPWFDPEQAAGSPVPDGGGPPDPAAG